MYCEKCGRKYASDENFCAECGSKLVDELEIYAKQFLNGDESAFEKIYNHTKINVFTYVFMYFKNQEDCLDCIREIYLKLFYKINLYEPQNGNFRIWFNMFVKREFIGFAKRNAKELLIEEENIGNSEQIDNIEIDSKEVTELLNEILSVLSREQKICVTGFYFEGKNQKEISEILGESEETINNYLLLAGKEMEEKVSELEKMQKLRRYGLSPFRFFLFLRATESVKSVDFDLLQQKILEQKVIVEQIRKDTEEVVDETQTVPQKKPIFIKTMIAFALVAIIGVGSFLGYKVYQKQSEKPQQEKKTAEKDVDKELRELKENIDMEYLKGALILLPEFTEKENISETQVCEMAYRAGVAKYFNERTNKNFYMEANTIDNQQFIEAELDENEYKHGYVLLKKDAFVPIFEMVGKKYDKNISYENETGKFSQEGNVIKLWTEAIIEPGGEEKVKEVRMDIDSENKQIIVTYTREIIAYDDEYGTGSTWTLENGEKYLKENYRVYLSPANNKQGYVFERKEKIGEDFIETPENEEEEPQELSVKERETKNVAKVEAEAKRRDQTLSDTATQREMNEHSEQLYKLWDDELNRLWKVLKEELSSTEMAKLLEEQRTWIAEKEKAIKEIGEISGGGTATTMNKNMMGEDLTRERVYELLEYLP